MNKLLLGLIYSGTMLSAAEFETKFTPDVDRYFVAPDIWTNPMEAWKLRKVDGDLKVEIDIAALSGKLLAAGINVGVRSELAD